MLSNQVDGISQNVGHWGATTNKKKCIEVLLIETNGECIYYDSKAYQLIQSTDTHHK